MKRQYYIGFGVLMAVCLSNASCKEARSAYLRGEALLQSNEYHQAISFFDEALHANPELGQAHAARGVCNWHLRQLKQARLDFEKALSSGENSSRTYVFYAMTLGELGENKAAASELTKGISIHPQDANLYFVRAAASFQLREYTSALEDVAMALKLNDKHLIARRLRGEIYYEQGREKEALAELDAHLEMRPDDEQAQKSRAKVLARMKTNEN